MNQISYQERLKTLKELVERFRENIEDYKSLRYDEENTKSDFIDKFFAILGWDVYNNNGFSEDFREVIKEDKVVYRGHTISPDYVFRIGKERQFFVEAKKPSVNIKENVEPAFQVRRYAYTADLPISILTDFEEFAVYDTRIKPNVNDKAGAARIFYCNYLEYEKNFDFLFNTFSKDAVLKGKLKKYSEDGKKKKGTQPVDKAMLATIDGWRINLARNVAIRNKELDIYQLNEAVQKIIDRIIFLRIAEDRNTESERSLEIITENKNIYENLVKYFHVANDRYNSGLFKVVDWLDELVIDDKIFKDIIKDVYFPSPYEFSVLPIEILGQIYEQFLGKTIRLTPSHQAKVEEKPEVRKAGGVYYTPKYIVDYIVENTVGKLLGERGVEDREQGLGFGEQGVEDREQGLGDRVQGFEDKDNFNKTNFGARDEQNNKLSRPDSMAGSDESNGNGLQDNKEFPERGDLRIDKSNKTGGGINSGEYCRGARQDAQKRIPESSFNSEGIPDGTRNASSDCQSDKLYSEGGSSADMGKDPKSWEIANRSDKISSNSHSLTTKPHSLSPGTPKTLKILDPACGSGSFLVGAYDYLLQYYLLYYTQPENLKKSLKDGRIYEAGNWALGIGDRDLGIGDRGLGLGNNQSIPKNQYPKTNTQTNYRLTIREKRNILINNIFGVDIDAQAVEVTKLSLLLKLMEGEITESRGELFRKSVSEALLPDLSDNIKCGNSLIGSDFYDDKDLTLFDYHEQRKINCFDWEDEFPHIFKKAMSKFHHVTFNTKYSRNPDKHKPKNYTGEMVLLSQEEREEFAKILKTVSNKLGIKIIAAAILPDHVHLIIADFGKDIKAIVKEIKGVSAHDLNRRFKSSVQGGGRQNTLWAKSFEDTFLEDEKHLFNAVNYVENNYKKHEEKWGVLDNHKINAALSDCIKGFESWNAYEYESGGFDVVIGNPPYGAELNEIERLYLENKFKLHNTDTAALFMNLSIKLLNLTGINSFIVPKPFVYASNWKIIRNKIIKKLETLIDCGKVWKKVKLEQVIFIALKQCNSSSYLTCKRSNYKIETLGKIDKSTFYEFGFLLNGITNSELTIARKMKASNLFLNDLVINQRGAMYQKYINSDNADYKVYGGKEIKRFSLTAEPKGYIEKKYINDGKAFIKHDSILAQRIVAHVQKPIDHLKIIATLSEQIHDKNSIIVDTINQLNNISEYDSKFILGIINSKIISWYSYRFIFAKAIRTMQFDNPTTSRIPLPKNNLNNPKQKAQHDRMVNLVEQMLEAQKYAHSDNIKTDTDKKLAKQRVDILDRQIDALVYELYELTDEEIAIVEENSP